MKNVKIHSDVLTTSQSLSDPYPFNVTSKAYPLSTNWILNITYASTKRLKIFNNINKLDDGVYTYIIYMKSNGTDIVILFAKVNIYELGTKHSHIDSYRRENYPSHKLFIAGELKKTGGEIVFNFESGTYTKNKIGNIQHKFVYTGFSRLSLENYVKRIFTGLMKNKTVSVHYTSKTLINTNAKKKWEYVQHCDYSNLPTKYYKENLRNFKNHKQL